MKALQTIAILALFATTSAALASAQKASMQKAVDVSGVWEVTSESPRGTMTRKVTFVQDGTALTGTMESRMGSLPIEKGSVEGDKISFTVEFSMGDRRFEIVYTGTVEGEKASGTFLTPRGDEVPWTAKRVEEPK